MKTTIYFLLVSISAMVAPCNPSEPKKEKAPEETVTEEAPAADGPMIAIMAYDSSMHWLFRNASPAELDREEVAQIEEIVKKCLAEYNAKQEKRFEETKAKHPDEKIDKANYVIDLARYDRQFIPVINSKGEKEVWINCFCKSGGADYTYKGDIVLVQDGGNCYFNLKVNLSTGKYYDLQVNGEA